MNTGSKNGRGRSSLRKVQGLLVAALDLLDLHGGAPQVAAHVELALGELRTALANGD